MNNSVQVRILGRDYTLRSQQSAEQVRQIADFIDQKLSETAAGKMVDTRDLAALTLLNLAGQYLQLQQLRRAEQEQVDRLQAIVAELERAVSGC